MPCCDLTNKPKLMNKTLFIYMRMNGGEFGLMFKRKKGGKKERKNKDRKERGGRNLKLCFLWVTWSECDAAVTTWERVLVWDPSSFSVSVSMNSSGSAAQSSANSATTFKFDGKIIYQCFSVEAETSCPAASWSGTAHKRQRRDFNSVHKCVCVCAFLFPDPNT